MHGENACMGRTFCIQVMLGVSGMYERKDPTMSCVPTALQVTLLLLLLISMIANVLLLLNRPATKGSVAQMATEEQAKNPQSVDEREKQQSVLFALYARMKDLEYKLHGTYEALEGYRQLCCDTRGEAYKLPPVPGHLQSLRIEFQGLQTAWLLFRDDCFAGVVHTWSTLDQLTNWFSNLENRFLDLEREKETRMQLLPSSLVETFQQDAIDQWTQLVVRAMETRKQFLLETVQQYMIEEAALQRTIERKLAEGSDDVSCEFRKVLILWSSCAAFRCILKIGKKEKGLYQSLSQSGMSYEQLENLIHIMQREQLDNFIGELHVRTTALQSLRNPCFS